MVRHNFHEGNKIAHLLANQGIKKANVYQVVILLTPPYPVKHYFTKTGMELLLLSLYLVLCIIIWSSLVTSMLY